MTFEWKRIGENLLQSGLYKIFRSEGINGHRFEYTAHYCFVKGEHGEYPGRVLYEGCDVETAKLVCEIHHNKLKYGREIIVKDDTQTG